MSQVPQRIIAAIILLLTGSAFAQTVSEESPVAVNLSILSQEESPSQSPGIPVKVTVGATDGNGDAGGERLAFQLGKLVGVGKHDELLITERASGSQSHGWFLDVAPNVDLESGDESSFNHVIGKVTGNLVFFDVGEVEGVPVVDWGHFVHVVPLSIGVEADDKFTFVNVLAECGYVPFLLNESIGPQYKLGLNPRAGVFIQAGRKFDLDETARIGNAEDESDEDLDSNIFRFKATASLEIEVPIEQLVGAKTTARAEATGWYDIANDDVYHRLSGIIEMKVSGQTSLEFRFDSGSGAPNFNEGDQFGVGLTVAF